MRRLLVFIALLLLLGVSAPPSGAAANRVVKGSYTGTIVYTPDASCPTGRLAHFHAVGRASHMGRTVWEGVACEDPTNGMDTTVAAANGDTVQSKAVSQTVVGIVPEGDGFKMTAVYVFNVVDGTGRLAKYTPGTGTTVMIIRGASPTASELTVEGTFYAVKN